MTFDDVDFVYHEFSDPNITRYLMDEPPLTNRDEARDIVQFFSDPEKKTHNRWVLVRKIDNQSIGTCGFHKWEKQYFRAEIGYDMAPQFWGQGYMKESLEVVLANGFQQMGLNRIDALVAVENKRSLLLLQKLGFQQEGLLRDYFYLDGNFYDHFLLSLLKRE
jgi:ribosomal-protein-alanine N-acetyltransferase